MMRYGLSDMMSQETTHAHFLIRFFQDFYYEMLRQKEHVMSRRGRLSAAQPSLVSSEEKEKALGSSPLDEEAEKILKTLQNILEAQALAANYEGGAFGAACYKEAQYIMAVLADEIFLSLSWEGLRYWETSLLEERIFGTHIAGERFFQNLDHFLKERDPLKREIGILYLIALGLGFRGKYRGFDDQGALEYYREQLFVFIYHQKASLFEGHFLLFPHTTCATLEGLAEQEVQDIRTWSLVFLGVFASYLVLSLGVWYGVTHTLSRATNAILEDARTFS